MIDFEDYLQLRRDLAADGAVALGMELIDTEWGSGTYLPGKGRGRLLLTAEPPADAWPFVTSRDLEVVVVTDRVPAEVSDRILADGTHKFEATCQVMAHDDIATIKPAALPDGYDLQPIELGGVAGLPLSEALDCAMAAQPEWPVVVEDFLNDFPRFPNMRGVAAVKDGLVHATAASRVIDDNALVIFVTTRFESRNLGLATTMTAHALASAVARGARRAILDAAPAGVGVYRRLGFTQLGTITYFERC